MKNRVILFTVVAFMASAIYAQDIGKGVYVIDENEDTTNVVSVKNILLSQRRVFSRKTNSERFKRIWASRPFFNISYMNETLTPAENVPITDPSTSSQYLNNGKAVKYKSNWGISLQNGINLRLHKTPITEMITFCLDVSWIEFSVAHFKAESSDSLKAVDNTFYEDKHQFYIPYNAEKYEANYGVSLGPSLSIAPFTLIDSSPGLHFFKINVYYHIGYNASVLLFNNDDSEHKSDRTNNDGLSFAFGHGLSQSFGVNLNWKRIGVGYEQRTTSYKYKSLKKDIYGDNKYKFDSSSTRFYLRIKF